MEAKARCEHDVFRAEVRLRRGKIDQRFEVADNSILTHIAIDRAYAAYRDVLLGFGAVKKAVPKQGGIEDFLAWVTIQLPDFDVVNQYAAMKPVKKRQLTGLRREVGNRVLTLNEFSWARLLPEGHLPSVVEIVKERDEKHVGELFGQLDRIGMWPPPWAPTSTPMTVAATT